MNIYKIFTLILPFFSFVFVGCSTLDSENQNVVKNNVYVVTTNKVIQGNFEATAISPCEIVTNYKSPADEKFSSIIEFRFSLNSRDNEMKAGFSHFAVVGESDSVIFKFGESNIRPEDTYPELDKNTKWTVLLDMNPVLDSFEKNGYFVTETNDTIYSEDFKGVWIAGNANPLTWDFENLYGKDDRKLMPTDKKGIYQVSLTLNPPVESIADKKGWKVDAPNENYPTFSSQTMLVDALYNMAIDDLVSDIRPDDTFRAGIEWDGVWTRDVSYSIYLALAYLDPQRSINSLKAKVKNDRIIQDTGTGGSWPISSDRIVWATAAWELYKVTGDREWLKFAYNVVRNTIADDEFAVYDKHYGLMHGEQSYLDWREQTYPKWMQPKDIYESMTFGTNILFANAYEILNEMSEELGIENTDYEEKAEAMKTAINKHMWIDNKGYYSEYLYGAPYHIQSQAVDNLGQALAVIFEVAEDDRAESVISKTPVTLFGTTSIYPMIKNIKPYHNNAVWPFVQSYWNLAAAKVGNKKAVLNGLGAIYRAAALFGTNKELFVASTGDFRGTAVNSDAQLWSVAGNIAMIYRMYAGMEFKTDGIEFEPFVPSFMQGDKVIKNFKYRNSVLDIIIKGCGDEVKSMTIDGVAVEDEFFSAEKVGNHTIVITMNGSFEHDGEVNMKEVVEMAATPEVKVAGKTLDVLNFVDGLKYNVYYNGDEEGKTSTYTYNLKDVDKFTQIMVNAFDGVNQSFCAAPDFIIPAGKEIIVLVAKYAQAGTEYVKGPRANDFVEVTVEKNTTIDIPVNVPETGTYFVDVRYANGNGPINTENKCALRTLLVNGITQGPVVMPQRGLGEWLSTGYSNMLQVELNEGHNTLTIKYVTPQNVNMNGDVNTALIKHVRIIKK